MKSTPIQVSGGGYLISMLGIFSIRVKVTQLLILVLSIIRNKIISFSKIIIFFNLLINIAIKKNKLKRSRERKGRHNTDHRTTPTA